VALAQGCCAGTSVNATPYRSLGTDQRLVQARPCDKPRGVTGLPHSSRMAL